MTSVPVNGCFRALAGRDVELVAAEHGGAWHQRSPRALVRARGKTCAIHRSRSGPRRTATVRGGGQRGRPPCCASRAYVGARARERASFLRSALSLAAGPSRPQPFAGEAIWPTTLLCVSRVRTCARARARFILTKRARRRPPLPAAALHRAWDQLGARLHNRRRTRRHRPPSPLR
jgi:hypothetical protein